MDKHFLKSYVDLLIATCHKRGVHAMGGMSAYIPVKDDPAANEAAISQVLADKTREVLAGHDGTWVAHPGLIPIALAAFDKHMPEANQIHATKPTPRVTQADLLKVPEGSITEQGIRNNIRVGIQYLHAWLRGNGCVPLNHLMEDAATAEICRAQLWQWLRFHVHLDSGKQLDRALLDRWVNEEVATIPKEQRSDDAFIRAKNLFTKMVTNESFDDFLTLPAYQEIIMRGGESNE